MIDFLDFDFISFVCHVLYIFDTFVIDVKGGEIRENYILYIVSYIGGEIYKGERYRNCTIGEIRDIHIV